MNILDFDSLELKAFVEDLENLKKMIQKAFMERKPLFNGDLYLTNKDVFKALHVSERTLQEYRDIELIPYIQISGGKILYKESDILKVLEENYSPIYN